MLAILAVLAILSTMLTTLTTLTVLATLSVLTVLELNTPENLAKSGADQTYQFSLQAKLLSFLLAGEPPQLPLSRWSPLSPPLALSPPSASPTSWESGRPDLQM